MFKTAAKHLKPNGVFIWFLCQSSKNSLKNAIVLILGFYIVMPNINHPLRHLLLHFAEKSKNVAFMDFLTQPSRAGGLQPLGSMAVKLPLLPEC